MIIWEINPPKVCIHSTHPDCPCVITLNMLLLLYKVILIIWWSIVNCLFASIDRLRSADTCRIRPSILFLLLLLLLYHVILVKDFCFFIFRNFSFYPFVGVIWKGEKLIDGVPETLDLLRSHVFPVLSFLYSFSVSVFCEFSDKGIQVEG